MASRKRSREGRNMTAERKARAEARANAAKSAADPKLLEEVRKYTKIQSKDRGGEMSLVFKDFLKGKDMEAILEVGDTASIAAGLLEAMKHGMRIEVDAQVVLTSAEQSVRLALAKVFEAEADEMLPSMNERQERQARFLESLARRMSWRPKAKVKREKAPPKPKPEKLEAVLDRALAFGDAKAAAKAIAETRHVNDDVREHLERLQDRNPDLARDLAVNIRRRARKMNGGKARFLNSLAANVEPAGTSQLPTRKPEKRRAA
jgi:hypothetical protein